MQITNRIRKTARQGAVSLFLVVLFTTPAVAETNRTSDEFLTGYVISILERDLQWQRDSCVLKIKKRGRQNNRVSG